MILICTGQISGQEALNEEEDIKCVLLFQTTVLQPVTTYATNDSNYRHKAEAQEVIGETERNPALRRSNALLSVQYRPRGQKQEPGVSPEQVAWWASWSC